MQRLKLITALLIALIGISCTAEEAATTPTPHSVPIAVVADTDDTRLAVEGNTTMWQVGDRLTLCFIAGYTSAAYATLAIESPSDISHDGKRATFRGSAPQGTYYGIMALYPAVESPSTTILLDRKAADNIFLTSFQSYEYNPITIGTNTQIPISFAHLMHKVDFNISLAEGYTSDVLQAQSIAIEMSATANGQPIAFSDTAALNIRSNSLTTQTTTESITAYGRGSTISTMLFPMNTMRNVALTISIYVDGTLRHVVHKPESGTLQSLKMSPGKSTTINITLSDANSVGGGGEIVQKPITLHTTAIKIKANGVESATLRVTEEDGTDVTTQCTLHLEDGTPLQSTIFLTTTPGTYTIYAERHGMRSNEITITAEAVTATGKRVVFAEGVTLTTGWYDVNKKSTPQVAQADAMMCWAASSSNIIQWFQDRYVAAGNTLPAGCPNGTSSSYGYELQIMDTFRNNWDNLARGNWTDGGVIWYFEGRDLYKTNGTENRAYPRSGTGGYFKSVWSNIFPSMMYEYEDTVWGFLYNPTTYITEVNNYMWRGGVADPLLKFSEYIVEAFEHGMSSMAVAMSSNFNGAHAVTIWGYEIDNTTGYVTTLYIADSDDGATPTLQPYTVHSDNSNAKIRLSGYATYYPFALYPASGYGSKR